VIIVRYADDAVLGFQHRYEAERFLEQLRERLGKFGLGPHPEKARLIEFGRYAAERRKAHGKGKPETFTFLGFSVLQKCTGKEVAWPNQSWTSCVIDEGGPLGIGFQEQVSNHLQAAAVTSRWW
jgi:hypothetical protein